MDVKVGLSVKEWNHNWKPRIWFLRRILRIAEHGLIKSNDEVLQRANTSRNLLEVIVSRHIRFVGHVIRKNQLEDVALTGLIEGKRAKTNENVHELDIYRMWR